MVEAYGYALAGEVVADRVLSAGEARRWHKQRARAAEGLAGERPAALGGPIAQASAAPLVPLSRMNNVRSPRMWRFVHWLRLPVR